MKKDKSILINTLTAVVYEIIAVVAGLILPRLILTSFGSSYNGIVSSITQFLSFVVLIRSGIGGVAKIYLYKSLNENDITTTSKVMHATNDFMKKVSIAFFFILLLLALVYPFIISSDWISTALLVIICGISSLAENYYGISSMILLQADKKEYLISLSNIVTTILNVIISAVLINLNQSIHIVRLGVAFVFCLKPLFLNFFVRKHYKLDRTISYEKNILQQKKDAFVHVVAEFIHRNTDIIILTIFTNTLIVSVYTVYAIVSTGLRKLTNAFTSNIEAILGELYNSKDKDEFNKVFNVFEFFVFNLSTIIYVICGCVFCSFINVYTSGVTDINYIIPLYAVLVCIGEFFDLIKTPYQFLIRIAGKFKETKYISFIEAILNILISIILVHSFGLIGIAVGTLIAMLWRSVAYALYVYKQKIMNSIVPFAKYIITAGIICLLFVVINYVFHFEYAQSYGSWILQSIIITFFVIIITLVLNLIISKKECTFLFAIIVGFLKKKRR